MALVKAVHWEEMGIIFCRPAGAVRVSLIDRGLRCACDYNRAASGAVRHYAPIHRVVTGYSADVVGGWACPRHPGPGRC